MTHTDALQMPNGEELTESPSPVEKAMPEALRGACSDYLRYLESILEPALEDLESASSARSLKLHQVIGANLCAAHAVDYIHAIRTADGLKGSRTALIKTFDTEYGVLGARIDGGKMPLIDAINNAMKHIRIDPKRYVDLVQKYGQVSFECLVEDDGRVLCMLDGHRFDYVRVVLIQALRALKAWSFEDEEDVLEFARGGIVTIDYGLSSIDDDDPIDNLIEACNPSCQNCGEYEDDCQCAEYVFDGKTGAFEPRFATTAELDNLFSAVSGAYRRDRL